ncbi:thioredoxin-domain-containing protein [Sporormia fimetaria CBS 119925]|uniref:protein disulfide-isomerase n=1 Tax=Sporormia fimetaria CBS 119925 TaxID=1340428 RepID=A0A6A6VK13_9PLEO|nr:thioredoxin-domain-containing protein [Sporormia fimetaria CBS 119925]
MVHTSALLVAAASLAASVAAEGLYSKNSAVLQITGVDYDRVITKSNYTSIVEFYAPWCGHCKNLKPAYESAAKSLAGIAKVAAVNCDDELNKPFCGKMGVQGFPTLKIVRPGKKPGKPTVEDYQGQRSAKAIVEAVKDRIPNTVKRVTDKNLDEWLKENNDTAKAILFSDKGTISATLKTLAVDFAGLIPIAQVRNKESKAVETFGVESYPTLILLPGGAADAIKYDGEMKKDAMVKFLSQVTAPNPDCPEPKSKKSKKDEKNDKKQEKKESKSSSKFARASASHKSSEASSAATSAASETVEEPIQATESPDPKVNDDDQDKPVVLPEEELPAQTIPIFYDAADLQAVCLNAKSKTCILAILPKDEAHENAKTALASLAAIHKKQSHLFPFFGVSASNTLVPTLVKELSLDGDENKVHLVATNGKRSWVKKYPGNGFGAVAVEAWVDAIRMGEGRKEKLPESLFAADSGAADEEKAAKQEPAKADAREPIQVQLEEAMTEEPDLAQKHDEL